MKKLLIILMFILVGCSSLETVNDVPKKSSELYYYDVNSPQYITKENQEIIIYTSKRLKETNGVEIVVAFYDNDKSYDLDTFSPKVASTWGIGDAEKDNGILISFAYNNGDNNVRIDVGRGIESVITDGQAGRLLDKHIDLIKSEDIKDIEQGIMNVHSELVSALDGDIVLESNDLEEIVYLVTKLILLIVVAVFIGGSGTGFIGYSGSSGGSGSFGGGSFGGGGASR